MAVLYHVSLDELIDFDIDITEIHEMIQKTSEEISEKIDWTSAWGKKYPVLLHYQDKVNTANYAYRLSAMLDEIEKEYQFSKQDAVLVLKDILYHVYLKQKNEKG